MSGFNGSYKQGLAWNACHDKSVDDVFFGGGARSGKSVFICAHEIIEATTWPGTRGLIGRKEYTSLRDSTMQTWWEVMAMFGYKAGREFTWNGNDQEVKWNNGSLTMFRHLKKEPSDPNYTRLGSTAFTRAALDEGDECDERLVEMLLVRTGFNPPPHGGKVIVTGNPGEYWTKYRYVYTKGNEPVVLNDRQRVILATVADNPDPIVRAEYTRRLEAMSDPYDRARLLHGDWLMQPRTGSEFFHAYDSAKHIKRIPYDPALALHISFDFNAAPYMTLLVSQIRRLPMQRWHVHFLQEICLEHPLSTTKATCERFKMELREGKYKGHNAGLFFYGDASGRSRTSMATEEVQNNYGWVDVILGPWLREGQSDRALRHNPTHVAARDFSNDILAGKMPIEVSFDPDMHNTLRDMATVKQDADGGIMKVMATDKAGNKYQLNSHCGQAMYYELVGAFPAIFEDHQKIAV